MTREVTESGWRTQTKPLIAEDAEKTRGQQAPLAGFSPMFSILVLKEEGARMRVAPWRRTASFTAWKDARQTCIGRLADGLRGGSALGTGTTAT